MSAVIGHRRYARETYPTSPHPGSTGPTGPTGPSGGAGGGVATLPLVANTVNSNVQTTDATLQEIAVSGSGPSVTLGSVDISPTPAPGTTLVFRYEGDLALAVAHLDPAATGSTLQFSVSGLTIAGAIAPAFGQLVARFDGTHLQVDLGTQFLREFNVRQYPGCDPTGTTDSTAAFAAAIAAKDAAGAPFAVIHIPRGTYNLTSFDLGTLPCLVTGEVGALGSAAVGFGSILNYTGPANGSLVTFGASNAGDTNGQWLRAVTLTTSNNDGTIGLDMGAALSPEFIPVGLHVEDVTIVGFGTGWSTGSTESTIAENVQIYGCTVGFLMAGTAALPLGPNNCRFDWLNIQGCATGMVLRCGTQNTFRGGILQANSVAHLLVQPQNLGIAWEAQTPYAEFDNVTTAVGLLATCTVPGTSGLTEPAWAPGTVTDGTVTWSVGAQSSLNDVLFDAPFWFEDAPTSIEFDLSYPYIDVERFTTRGIHVGSGPIVINATHPGSNTLEWHDDGSDLRGGGAIGAPPSWVIGGFDKTATAGVTPTATVYVIGLNGEATAQFASVAAQAQGGQVAASGAIQLGSSSSSGVTGIRAFTPFGEVNIVNALTNAHVVYGDTTTSVIERIVSAEYLDLAGSSAFVTEANAGTETTQALTETKLFVPESTAAGGAPVTTPNGTVAVPTAGQGVDVSARVIVTDATGEVMTVLTYTASIRNLTGAVVVAAETLSASGDSALSTAAFAVDTVGGCTFTPPTAYPNALLWQARVLYWTC